MTKSSRPSILKAIGWNSAAAALSAVVGFLRAPILARLLTPEDYGLFGLTTSVVLGVTSLTNFGFSIALITRNLPEGRETDDLVDSAWTADLLRRCGVTILLALLAYPTALFFGDRRLFLLLLAIAFTPAISGLQNIGLVLLRKEVSFRGLAYFRVGSELLVTVVSIALAWVTRNVWALVLGQVVAAFASAVLSYTIHPRRPRFVLNRDLLKDSFAFGRQLYVIGVLTFITTQFDSLVVGKFLGPVLLGSYLVAYRLASLPVDMLNETIGTVMFPAVAKARTLSREDTVHLLLKSIVFQFAGLAMLLLPLRLAAPEAIRIVYGNQWDAAVPILVMLTPLALFRGWARSIGQFLLGMGRGDFEARSKIIEVSLFIPLSIFGVKHYGAAGVALAGTASYFVAFVIRFVLLLRLFPEAVFRINRTLIVVLGLTAFAYFSGRLLTNGIAAMVLFEFLLTLSIGLCFRHMLPDFRRLLRS